LIQAGGEHQASVIVFKDNRDGQGPRRDSSGTGADGLPLERDPQGVTDRPGGGDIIKVKELLGHRHVTTTQVYDKRRRSLKEGASHDVPI
jgi:hypothetical protein